MKFNPAFSIVNLRRFLNDPVMAVPQDAIAWLRAFSQAVRDQNFQAGRRLCDPGVVAFGTVCCRAEGLDQLVKEQWNCVWPNTRDFDFDYESADAFAESKQIVVLANWHSTGLAAAGRPFQRHGRCTIVLRLASSGWSAVHTHFSINPVHQHDPLLRA